MSPVFRTLTDELNSRSFIMDASLNSEGGIQFVF